MLFNLFTQSCNMTAAGRRGRGFEASARSRHKAPLGLFGEAISGYQGYLKKSIVITATCVDRAVVDEHAKCLIDIYAKTSVLESFY